jgi:hypothetical protein
MDRVPGSAYFYAPDGLEGEPLDELIAERMPRWRRPQGLHRRCWTEVQLSSVGAGWNAEQRQ